MADSHQAAPSTANPLNTRSQPTDEPAEATETPKQGDDDAEADDDAAAYGLELAATVTQTARMPLWREVVFVGVVASAQFVTQAGLGQVIPIINVIGAHYNLHNGGELSWLLAAYSLTVGTFILVAGRLGDMFGYKLMLMIGYAWFALWTLVAGTAYYSNHVLFNFARVFQGFGPAMLLPNGLAILGASYAPGPRKHLVFAIFGAAAPTGSLLGATFAALFSLTFWPWAFWAMGIALAGLTGATALFVHDPPRKIKTKGRSLRQILSELDALGGVTGVTGLVLFNLAWNQAGVVTWPAQPYLWVFLILGALFIAAFLFVELRVARFPLVPFRALSSDVAFVLGCIACGWGSFGIWIYYFWLFLLNQHHVTPIQSAAWAIPLIPSGIAAALTTGRLLSVVRPGWVMICSMLAFLTGAILIATAPPDQVYWAQVFVSTLIIAWGMDMSFPAATVILSDAVPREHQGVGASLVNTVVNYSISIALGFAGTVEYYEADGDQLKGYRSALYVSIGLAGLGVCVAATFLLKSYWVDWRSSKRRAAAETQESEKV